MSAVSRAGDVIARKKAHQSLAEVGHLRSTYKQCRVKCDKLSDAWEMERAKTEKANGVLLDATSDLAILQETIDAPTTYLKALSHLRVYRNATGRR